jgi:hypothetical protein
MKEYYNEKGKLFTDVVSKEALAVIIQTIQHTIRGEIYLLPEDRLIDDLNQPVQFLAVTNAVVYSHNGEELYRAGFLTLNRANIIWVMPEQEISEKPAYLGEN